MDQAYKKKFAKLLQRDNTNFADKERRALFYIIAGNDELFKLVNHLYDFEEHCIKSDVLESKEILFTSATRELVRLGFNLYNDYNPADVSGCLSVLDEENLNLAIEAIRIRFL